MKALALLTVYVFINSLDAAVNKQDIWEINALITTLRRKIRATENAIKWIASEKKRFNDIMGKTDRSLTSTIKKRVADLNKHRANVKKDVLKHVVGSFDQAKKIVAGKADSIFKNQAASANQEYTAKVKAVSPMKQTISKSVDSYAKPLGSKSKTLVTNFKELETDLQKAVDKKTSSTDSIAEDLYTLSRQVQLQQFNEYEKARSDGNSGIKQVRSLQGGLKNYYSNDHNGRSFMGIHNRETMRSKVGISEFVAVLNGIEFRAGKDSYDLKKAVSGDRTLHKTEAVPFPTVPDVVSSKTGVKAQIDEMREWFKAFQNEDHSKRDYRDYFKPIISYLEGAWSKNLDDEKMREKIHYSSFTGLSGHNNGLEYLPRKIMGFADKKPVYSQWNYRILSHRVQRSLPKSFLKLVNDPVTEKRLGISRTTYKHSPSARFDIEGVTVTGKRTEVPLFYTILDEIMEEIPGKENYGGSIFSDGFDSHIFSAHPNKNKEKLNTAYYHRTYKLGQEDAMGVDKAQRGFADRLYIAANNQDEIAGAQCETKINRKEVTVKAKVSYAIPVEFIFLNPLHEWNPYEIDYKEDCSQVQGTGTENNPFNAACPDRHFLTPNSFFVGGEANTCSTPENGDELFYFTSPKTSSPVCLRASGVRIVLPRIHGVDEQVRQRYPIAPINGEGSSVWKKLNAFEDAVHLSSGESSEKATYNTGESTSDKVPAHRHVVVLTVEERNSLINGEISSLKKVTEPGKHRHILTIKMITVDGVKKIGASSCDSGASDGKVCWDKHENVFIEVK